MSATPEFEICHRFFTLEASCREALKHLSPSAAIRVRLPSGANCTLRFDGKAVRFENQPPANPDVEFELNERALEQIPSLQGTGLGRLGVEVLQAIARGDIRLRVCGSLWRVMRDGYLKIIFEAGPEFTKMLKEKGLSSPAQIIALIKNLR